MTRPFFTRDRISDFDIFEDHADRALKLAKDRLAEGHAVDIQVSIHCAVCGLPVAPPALFYFPIHMLTPFLGFDIALHARLCHPIPLRA